MNDSLRELTYVQAIGEGFFRAMEKDQKVFLMGEGVDNVTGVYGTTLKAFGNFGPKRVIDTPLSENALTGIAIGAAMDGLRPVLIHQRNDFMLLTMDQLVNNAAKLKFVSAGRHSVPLTVVSFVARKPGEGVQHSQSLQALFAHIPGLKVVMPASPRDARDLLIATIQDDDPVIVLFHRSLFEEREWVPDDFSPEDPYSAKILQGGSDVTVVAVSVAVRDAKEAARLLKDEVSLEIIDLRSIRPLDTYLIVNSLRNTGRLLVVDTGWTSFGVSAEIVAQVAEQEDFSLFKAPPKRIGMLETPAPATPFLLTDYHPTAEHIVLAVRQLMNY
ncbi:MAG TPA: transketolase C-terminal domain-containing protein [Candidatus Paceibacterota bacterium]